MTGWSLIDLTGQKFGALLVTGRWPLNDKGNKPIWETRCDCGNAKLVRASALRAGQKHCGLHPNHRTHGMSRRAKEYQAWASMIQRCENPKKERYPGYGGRGIRVCTPWRESFEAFLDDVGFAPSPQHSLDRINVNGHYEPGNVRWADRMTQRHNRRDTKEKTHGRQRLGTRTAPDPQANRSQAAGRQDHQPAPNG